MIDSAEPIGVWQCKPLVIRDRDERRIGKVVPDIRQAGNIKAAVHRGKKGNTRSDEQWQGKPVDVAVDDVEVGSAPCYGFQQDRLHGDRVGMWPAEAKR